MGATLPTGQVPSSRAVRALAAVLPAAVRIEASASGAVTIADRAVQLLWVGEGALRDIREVLALESGQPDIVAARHLSPAAREKLSDAGMGWVDESGAAEIALPTLVVSRSGQAPKPARLRQWTPAVVAVAEALLCGTSATVAATEAATGLSAGSCTTALRFLTEHEWLAARASRGRNAARRLVDADGLLSAYAEEVAQRARQRTVGVTVGLQGRDLIAALAACGKHWSAAEVPWAATGAAAATLIAPYLTHVSTAEVYLDADTDTALEAAAAVAGLRLIEGGRLTLRPFPTSATSRLAKGIDGFIVAPWPRVYADLRLAGVRGEEAAEHLREVAGG